MQVAQWGNRIAVRLPKTVVEALNLKSGDDIRIEVVGTRAVEIEKVPEIAGLIGRVRALRGKLPADFKFDRLEANER